MIESLIMMLAGALMMVVGVWCHRKAAELIARADAGERFLAELAKPPYTDDATGQLTPLGEERLAAFAKDSEP